MSKNINIAMILAAGRGTRMKHLTDNCPKPLIEIHHKSILSHLVSKIKKHGLEKIVVNTCYKADMIKKELEKHDMQITFSDEEIALETGGGVKNALPELIFDGMDGFFVLNADPLWEDNSPTLLAQLEAAWDPSKMDILLAVVPTTHAFGDVQDGNYFIENGKLRRKRENESNIPYIFTGVQILHPRIFANSPIQEECFSLRDLYDKAQAENRLAHVVFEGRWFHVGTPEAVVQTEKMYMKV